MVDYTHRLDSIPGASTVFSLPPEVDYELPPGGPRGVLRPAPRARFRARSTGRLSASLCRLPRPRGTCRHDRSRVPLGPGAGPGLARDMGATARRRAPVRHLVERHRPTHPGPNRGAPAPPLPPAAAARIQRRAGRARRPRGRAAPLCLRIACAHPGHAPRPASAFPALRPRPSSSRSAARPWRLSAARRRGSPGTPSVRARATPALAAAAVRRDRPRRSAARSPPAGRRQACSSRTHPRGRPRSAGRAARG